MEVRLAARDIIVVGASAGGVEALRTLVAGFPPGLPAAVFVVLHIGQHASSLPQLLTKAGALPAIHPSNGEVLVKGKIFVAPPDCHLLVALDRIRLSHGPKENRTRPAVNPLFRSAARSYGPRVAGVILTGGLDDGTAGLAEIKRKGGVAIVQDPDTALSPSMPENAITHVDVDHVLALAEIPKLLTSLALDREQEMKPIREEPLDRVLSGLTCPECRGPLWEERQGRIVEYRCRVGHAYSPLAMAQEHNETVERTLWSTLVALEEAADISEKLSSEPGSPYAEEVTKKRGQIELIKNILNEHREGGPYVS